MFMRICNYLFSMFSRCRCIYYYKNAIFICTEAKLCMEIDDDDHDACQVINTFDSINSVLFLSLSLWLINSVFAVSYF